MYAESTARLPPAARFSVTQAAVSRWETAIKEPSAENYIRMANMASKIYSFWFLEKARVDLAKFRVLILERKTSK